MIDVNALLASGEKNYSEKRTCATVTVGPRCQDGSTCYSNFGQHLLTVMCHVANNYMTCRGFVT